MSPSDLRIFSAALGFMAVVLKDVPEDQQATRAKSIGRLIESFCITAPGVTSVANQNFGVEDDPIFADQLIEIYKTNRQVGKPALLPLDRPSIIAMYDRLLQRQTRRRQHDFYAVAHEDLIANRINQLIEEEIALEGAAHECSKHSDR